MADEPTPAEQPTPVDEVVAPTDTETTTPDEPVAEEAKPEAEKPEESQPSETDSEETNTDEEKPLFESKPSDKKILKGIGLGILGLIVAIFVFFAIKALLYDGGLAWDERFDDLALEYATQGQISLGILTDSNDITDQVAVSSSCDKSEQVDAASRENKKITWNLAKALGKCTVTAKYRLKTIKKTYTIIPTEAYQIPAAERLSLKKPYEVDVNSDEDLDEDGLTNKEETKAKTELEISDTDGDGLKDGIEVKEHKTDPLKVDTDDDGLDDYNEIELGLNPLKADSKGDGVKDGKRQLSYSTKSQGVIIEISGTGNIANIGVDIVDDAAISRKTGLINKLYNFHTDGSMKSATVTIPYTDADLKAAGITNENELKIFYYDQINSKYEEVATTVNAASNTVSAKVSHFSYYVVGLADSGGSRSTANAEVIFVLDNSWSMYTNEQYKQYTGEEYSGGIFSSSDLEGNDSEGKRFTLTSTLAEKLNKRGMKIGLAEFRNDYKLANSVGSKISDIKNTLSGMNGKFITSTAGTNINAALTGSAGDFTDTATSKTIVILTDGQDSSLSSYRANELAKDFSNRKIRVCAIGFGQGTYNQNLSLITSMTGCGYYSSSDASGLEEVFGKIETELNDEQIDTDGDGKNDSLLVADSGFIVSRDGFSFNNYGSTLSEGGHCYGMALFAQLYYRGKLPLQHDAIELSKESKSYPYDLRYSTLKNYPALYNYKLQTNELKYVFGYELFDETEPADLYVLKDTTLAYGPDYRKSIDASKLFKDSKYKTTRDADWQMEKYGFTYEDVESLILDDEKMQSNSSAINSTDRSILNAIYAGFIYQDVAKSYNSGSSFMITLRNIIGKEHTFLTDSAGFVQLLATRLNNGEAPVIFSNFSGTGWHAINAVSLAQDSENHELYHIGVYDNNYPGELRYVDLLCNNNSCQTAKNSYYDHEGEIIRVTLSEEDDLKYFEEH